MLLKLTAKRPCRYSKNAHQFSHIAPPALAALNFLSLVCLKRLINQSIKQTFKAAMYKIVCQAVGVLYTLLPLSFYGIFACFSIVFAVFRKKSKILPCSWTCVVYLDMSPFSASVSPYIKYITTHLEMQKGIFTLPTYIISLYSSKKAAFQVPSDWGRYIESFYIHKSLKSPWKRIKRKLNKKILSRLRRERINYISGKSISTFANGDSRRCPKNP